MSEEQAVEVVPELSPLEELRKWYHANKSTPECLLALKHRHAMAPGVADELKARAPGESDEERELALLFALTQIAAKLDTHAVLLANIQVEHLPPAEPTVPASEHVALIEDAAARLSHAHRDLESERAHRVSLEAGLEAAEADLEVERARRAEVEAKLTDAKAELEAERAKSVIDEETPAEGVHVAHVDVTPIAPPSDAAGDEAPSED